MLSFSEKTGEESRPLICIKAQVVGRSFVLRFFWMVLIDLNEQFKNSRALLAV